MDGIDRISRNPAIMTGKPIIRGMRVTVGTVVGLVAAGHSFAEILEAYPYLEHEDILQALRYAAMLVSSRDGALVEAAVLNEQQSFERLFDTMKTESTE